MLQKEKEKKNTATMAPWIDIVYIDNEMQKKQYIFNG
jgi:hypothetical protein